MEGSLEAKTDHCHATGVTVHSMQHCATWLRIQDAAQNLCYLILGQQSVSQSVTILSIRHLNAATQEWQRCSGQATCTVIGSTVHTQGPGSQSYPPQDTDTHTRTHTADVKTKSFRPLDSRGYTV